MNPSVNEDEIRKLRDMEMTLRDLPNVEGYLRLAQAYEKLGLHKEVERLVQKAERFEQGGHTEHLHIRGYLLAGNISSSAFVSEVLQVVSRAQLSGELIFDCTGLVYRLFFQDGQLINALSPHRPPGFDSLVAATQLAGGTYRFLEKKTADLPRLIEGNLDMLLLQAAQINDETCHHELP
jgi:hypothetical protein